MASTTFTDGVTVILSAWLNDVNSATYANFGDGTNYTGNLTIGSSTFVVTAASGNLAIATNKFTVAGATGNTVIAGTLGVAGVVSVTNSTDAGNSTVGALVVTGGIGVGKSVKVATGFGVSIGTVAVRSGSGPTNYIDLYDGSAPAGTLANGCTLYSSGGNLFAMNSAGVSKQLTP